MSEHRFELDRGTERVTFTMEDGRPTALLREAEDANAWHLARQP